ncbi:hypothetical protein [Paenibacillus radicis (ex Gao et al. 2016)]|uniref:Uncharacterized protein n=1 Tax=Paenibacillus radicis (ex Gao et al. 2016) TaxID=1737354 RepID=A0A917HNV3_9BACL|nr:hypothetical protein [Paenibacillus radicis (ex Gao et al. 2016)]GGG84335.1 hypothetical protein GCM10010918_47700 [Paenibacillus radicis (ex Gao et al. 2016)]
MKKWVARIALGAVLVVGGFGIGYWNTSTIEADGALAVPGSVEDPVVTKSYVDALVGDKGQEGNTGGDKLEVVTVPNGKTLIANEGTEVIVRAGKAVAYSPDSNGLADVTGGKDVFKGAPIPANHLIIFPRAGRGITTDPGFTKTLTVLVRGGYTIQ